MTKKNKPSHNNQTIKLLGLKIKKLGINLSNTSKSSNHLLNKNKNKNPVLVVTKAKNTKFFKKTNHKNNVYQNNIKENEIKNFLNIERMKHINHSAITNDRDNKFKKLKVIKTKSLNNSKIAGNFFLLIKGQPTKKIARDL
jgi:hypothetical protein